MILGKRKVIFLSFHRIDSGENILTMMTFFQCDSVQDEEVLEVFFGCVCLGVPLWRTLLQTIKSVNHEEDYTGQKKMAGAWDISTDTTLKCV